MGPPQGRAEGEKNLPRPAAHTPGDAPQNPIGLLGTQGTLRAHGEPVIPQHRACAGRGCAGYIRERLAPKAALFRGLARALGEPSAAEGTEGPQRPRWSQGRQTEQRWPWNPAN